MIGRTVLILEAKCVLWPEEPLQYANFRSTLEKAAIQAARKRDRAAHNYTNFAAAALARGVTLPENADVICAVITNSSLYSGFSIRGVPVTDLWILEAFFDNDVVKIEIRETDRLVERHATRLYEAPEQAGHALESYLANPPQVSDAVNSIRKRSVGFAHGYDSLRPLTCETYEVFMEGDKILSRERAHRRSWELPVDS